MTYLDLNILKQLSRIVHLMFKYCLSSSRCLYKCFRHLLSCQICIFTSIQHKLYTMEKNSLIENVEASRTQCLIFILPFQIQLISLLIHTKFQTSMLYIEWIIQMCLNNSMAQYLQMDYIVNILNYIQLTKNIIFYIHT